MQQLPNVKDETCKNQDCAVLVSKRRQREAGNKRARKRRQGREKDTETETEKTGEEREKDQTGFVLITGAGKAEKSRDFCSLDYRFGSNAIFTYQIKLLPQTVRSEL